MVSMEYKSNTIKSRDPRLIEAYSLIHSSGGKKAHDTQTPIFAVIICTRNHDHILPLTIDAIARQIRLYCRTDVELIVVDNNSTDNTKSVIQAIIQKNRIQRNAKYCFEPTNGISYARNTGIANARSPVISFIDDDTVVDDNWLLNALYLIKKYRSADVITGKLRLNKTIFRHKEIKIIKKCDTLWSLGYIDFGPKPHRISNEYLIMINNTIVRKSVFRRIGYFDTQFGTDVNTLPVFGGEDIDLFMRIMQAGMFIMYDPMLTALHNIQREKFTRHHLIQRYWMNGIEIALFNNKYKRAVRSGILLFLLPSYYRLVITCLTFLRLQTFLEKYLFWCALRKAFLIGYREGVKSIIHSDYG
jgi:glucosyl-dolichyl phosphate glucuronosyltransferase